MVTLQVDPASLSQEDRDLIANRLEGIDVCLLWLNSNGDCHRVNQDGEPVHVMTLEPTLEALMQAVRENEKELIKDRMRRRGKGLKEQAELNGFTEGLEGIHEGDYLADD
jgi:hypothetical protein